MLNFNGELIPQHSNFINQNNRGLRYDDALFETNKVVNTRINFWEDHYLRLMASMRIFRMEIPMNFTMEFFEEQILLLITSDSNKTTSYRVRFSVYRKGNGFYLPSTNDVEYVITSSTLENDLYNIEDKAYEVELYKDAYITKQLFSTLK